MLSTIYSEFNMGITCQGMTSSSYISPSSNSNSKQKQKQPHSAQTSIKPESNEQFWIHKNDEKYRAHLRGNELYTGNITASEQYWDFCEKQFNTEDNINVRQNLKELNTEKESLKNEKYSRFSVEVKDKSEELLDELMPLQRKITERQNLGKTMIRVSKFQPIEKCEIQSEKSASDNIGPALKDMVDQLQQTQQTLKNLQQILKLFAVEEKITSEAFKKIIEIYSQKDDSLLNEIFIPLIIKIHSKIYDRLKKELNEFIHNQINAKMKEYEVQLTSQKEESDLISKIETLAEELAQKNRKISELEEDMSVQVALVKSSQHTNEQYKYKISAIQEDKQRLQKKIKKYSSVLKPYHDKRRKSKQAKLSEQSSNISQQGQVIPERSQTE